MAKIVELDEDKRIQLLIKKLKPNQRYRFSKAIKAYFKAVGDKKPREIRITFTQGEYLGHDEKTDTLVFRGTPLSDLSELGLCTFWVRFDTEMKLTLVKKS